MASQIFDEISALVCAYIKPVLYTEYINYRWNEIVNMLFTIPPEKDKKVDKNKLKILLQKTVNNIFIKDSLNQE